MRLTHLSLLISTMFVWGIASAQTSGLKSGSPIKSDAEKGSGLFALPSINAFAMGMADVNGDSEPDLFLQSDRWNPGTYLHLFEQYSSEGDPVFSQPTELGIPFKKDIRNRAFVHQRKDGSVLGFWGFGNSIKYSVLDIQNKEFKGVKEMKVSGLPRIFNHFGVFPLNDGRFLYLFSVQDSTYKRYPGRGPDVITYGPEGFWLRPIAKSGIYGAFVEELLPGEIEVKQLTSLKEAWYPIESFALIEKENTEIVLCGTRLGNILAYELNAKEEQIISLANVTDDQGITQRNPAIHAALSYFHGTQSNGLIASSEGGIYFYPDNGRTIHRNKVVLDQPRHLLQTNPDLYGTSLVVPNLVDWDDDGDLDIISGTSTGQIHFIENSGNNEKPVFETPIEIKAGGYEIHVQPGYNQDVQGPGESRWGYTCPAVVDWTGNGRLDILTGDSRGKFNIYINTGTKGNPQLEPERSLYIDGMDMHGTWRTRPGAGTLDGRMAYICLDTDDEFHLYWQLDAYNLKDGGKLTIGDSIPIRANFLNAGATGRAKILIVDWDEDGVKDLLVGTPRHGSIPEPVKGLPYHKENNGAAVIFLRNSGTESKPVYEYPRMLKFKNEVINLGQHSCAPAVGKIGQGGTNNLIVGDETGRFYFFERKDLSW